MSKSLGVPRLRVSVGGSSLDEAGAELLIQARVDRGLSLPSLCELRFLEPSPALVRQLGLGESLTLRVEGRSGALFDGQITAREHLFGPTARRELLVRAYDGLHALRNRHPLRSHQELRPSGLAERLVGDLGISVDPLADGPERRMWLQHGQSDLDLLQEACERSGLYFQLEDGVLALCTLEGHGEAVELALGEGLLEAAVELNSDRPVDTFNVAAWDPREDQVYTAASSGGADYDDRSDRAERTLTGEMAGSEDAAQALAAAELGRGLAGRRTLRAVADGDLRLIPGRRVRVRGLDDDLDGELTLGRVSHLLDAQRGFQSELSSEPPPRARRPREAVVAPGEIASVNDPDELGRAQVKLLAHGDTVSDWMPVVVPGAGAGKGLVALPGVGDRVVVLFAHGDPAQGIILGGLFGRSAPPDSGVEGGETKRFTLTTAGGQRVVLDDAQTLLRVEDKTGSYMVLKPDQVLLHAAVPLTVEAPGQPMTLRAQTIDFEQG